MRLAATILDRAVLEGPCNAKKAFCQEKKNPSVTLSVLMLSLLFQEGGDANESQTKYKIPLTFSRRKKYALVQICFLTGGRIRRNMCNKNVCHGERGVPVTPQKHVSQDTRKKEVTPLISPAGWGSHHLPRAPWRSLFSLSVTKRRSVDGKVISFFINFSNILAEYQMT